jgi:hypothetical protein
VAERPSPTRRPDQQRPDSAHDGASMPGNRSSHAESHRADFCPVIRIRGALRIPGCAGPYRGIRATMEQPPAGIGLDHHGRGSGTIFEIESERRQVRKDHVALRDRLAEIPAMRGHERAAVERRPGLPLVPGCCHVPASLDREGLPPDFKIFKSITPNGSGFHAKPKTRATACRMVRPAPPRRLSRSNASAQITRALRRILAMSVAHAGCSAAGCTDETDEIVGKHRVVA